MTNTLKIYKKRGMEIALGAGSYIKKMLGKKHSISYKGEINLVTDVDRAVEAFIIKNIKKSFPMHKILAEETAESYANMKKKAEFLWIIDPIDGTTNFAHSFPFFCTSIALQYNGKTVLGIVYEPIRNELFWAQKNGGAFLNRKKIHVSPTTKLINSLLITGFSYEIKKEKNSNLKHFSNFLKISRAIRRTGAAALDMSYVACGRSDGFWEFKLKPWDTAAAELIVREAGGKVSQVDGMPYSIYNNNILATNEKIHNTMISVFKKKNG